jgi:hypothetical protein
MARRRMLGTSLSIVLAGAATAGILALGSDEASADAVQTRHYYVAVDEVAWDYAPSGIDGITGAPFGEDENVFAGTGTPARGQGCGATSSSCSRRA